MTSYAELVARYHERARNAGLTFDQADAVRRDAERVATWDMHECNGNIQWAEDGATDHRGRALKSGRPYWVTGFDRPGGPPGGYWTERRDTFTPALERVRAAAASIGATLEYNADPRGWPFVFKLADGSTFAPPVRHK